MSICHKSICHCRVEIRDIETNKLWLEEYEMAVPVLVRAEVDGSNEVCGRVGFHCWLIHIYRQLQLELAAGAGEVGGSNQVRLCVGVHC